MSVNNLIVYSGKLCGDCQKLKAFLDAHNIPHETRDIVEHPEYREDLEKNTGNIGVPYLVIDGEWKIGYVKGEGYSESYLKELLGVG